MVSTAKITHNLKQEIQTSVSVLLYYSTKYLISEYAVSCITCRSKIQSFLFGLVASHTVQNLTSFHRGTVST